MSHEDALNKYPWYIRILFWFQKRKYGEVLNSSMIWARSPRIFLALSWLYGSLDRKGSPVSPVLRSLIIVRVSQMNGCSFCIDINTSVLMERGVEIDKALAIASWRESPLFSEEERAVLEYTESVTNSKGEIAEEIKQKMAARYGQRELMEITALIAYQNMSTKFNNAFGVEPQGFCSVEMRQ